MLLPLFRITWFFYRHWEHGGEDLLPGAGDGAAGVGGGPAILIHPVFQMDGRQAVSILQNCGFYSLLFYSTDLEMRRVRKPEQAAILCEYPATLFMRVGSGGGALPECRRRVRRESPGPNLPRRCTERKRQDAKFYFASSHARLR